MRVLQGGHDVPNDKLVARFPRTQANLTRAIHSLPHVLVYDNSDLASPFRQVGEFRRGQAGQPATAAAGLAGMAIATYQRLTMPFATSLFSLPRRPRVNQ